jgi:hypothetical protein
MHAASTTPLPTSAISQFVLGVRITAAICSHAEIMVQERTPSSGPCRGDVGPDHRFSGLRPDVFVELQ